MQREIKFRAWDLQDERMSEEFYPLSDTSLSFPDGESVFVQGNFVNNQYHWMQYTGESDKNGVDIYEGDIVKRRRINYAYDEWDSPSEPKYKDEFSVIEYRGHGFWVRDEDFGYEGEDLWSWAEMEVIGNIYENPELLQP